VAIDDDDGTDGRLQRGLQHLRTEWRARRGWVGT